MTERPRVSVVVPAYDEGEQVVSVPSYLRWYRSAFGPPLTAEHVRDRASGSLREQRTHQET